MRLKWLALLMFGLLFLGAKSGPITYFQMADPIGDDNGPGGYIYPRNIAFEPYKGLFDLTDFRVWQENAREVNFDVKIAKVTNPWMAPEGFIHPVVHIYIHTQPGGEIIPATPGPNVCFAPEYGWQYCLVAAGWGNSRAYAMDESNEAIAAKLDARLLADDSTIRMTVPATLIGRPDRSWKYYVLVGSFDGFGPGFFRDVRRQEGEWNFGGGLGGKYEPRVIDILAPAQGRYSQENQLRQDPTKGATVVLYPVGDGLTSGFRWWPQLGLAFCILLLMAGIYWGWQRGRILIFWQSVDKKDKDEEL